MTSTTVMTVDAAPATKAQSAKAKSGSSQGKSTAQSGGTIPAILTDAPQVPPRITRRHPSKVIVELEVIEVKLPISEGVDYTFWTFGGTVPGSFIRVRQGDTVEFHLMNHPDSRMPHNIDLHGVTGPGGGAASSFTAPGTPSQFTFKALNPGLYVYHCATAPVGDARRQRHVRPDPGRAAGGPASSRPRVLRDAGRLLHHGQVPREGPPALRHGKGHRRAADLRGVQRRRRVRLLGDKALKAKVGERVRLFVGNGGPNLVSSFHVIGEIFDRVYARSGTRYQENVQTTLVPAGGAAIVEFKVDVPGSYMLVDHSIFRAFNKGALGELKVEGPEDKAIYSGKQAESDYQAKGGLDRQACHDGHADESIRSRRVRRLYKTYCMGCHQAEGQGMPGTFPPLAKSDYLLADNHAQSRRS